MNPNWEQILEPLREEKLQKLWGHFDWPWPTSSGSFCLRNDAEMGEGLPSLHLENSQMTNDISYMYMFEKWRKQQNSTDRASVWFLNGWFCDKLMTIAFLSYQFISACSLSLPSQSWCLYLKSTGPISKIIQKHPLIFREISPLGPVVARSLAPMPPMPGGGTGAPEPQVSKSCLSSRSTMSLER